MLVSDGYQVTDQQKTVELVFGNDVVRGHLDGRSSVLGMKTSVLEVKALGKSEFKKMEAVGVRAWVAGKQEYAWQISGAMLAEGAAAHYVVKSRDSGVVVEEDFDTPFFTLADFQARLDELNEWVDKTGFPKCDHTGWCWNGPYRHVHYAEGSSKEPKQLRKPDNVVEILAEKLYDARMKRQAAESVEDELKSELLSICEPGNYQTDRLIVRVQEIASKRMDTKAVRAEFGDRFDNQVTYKQVKVEPKG